MNAFKRQQDELVISRQAEDIMHNRRTQPGLKEIGNLAYGYQFIVI